MIGDGDSFLVVISGTNHIAYVFISAGSLKIGIEHLSYLIILFPPMGGVVVKRIQTVLQSNGILRAGSTPKPVVHGALVLAVFVYLFIRLRQFPGAVGRFIRGQRVVQRF